jgi:uncharacterized protein YacL
MANATSNWVIIVCLVIFACVGIIGPYAGYDVVKIYQSPATDNATVSAWAWSWDNTFSISGLKSKILDVADKITTGLLDLPVVGGIFTSLNFISALLLFQVPNTPVAIGVFFWILGFILTVAVARVVAGLATGGGG